jgi:hypothetical protein
MCSPSLTRTCLVREHVLVREGENNKCGGEGRVLLLLREGTEGVPYQAKHVFSFYY